MTQTTAERTTQAKMTIPELISALADVQKLIANHDENCYLGMLTNNELGAAYYRLAEQLAKATSKLYYSH
jgi:hypothetical protein